jgi:hypothetical protein
MSPRRVAVLALVPLTVGLGCGSDSNDGSNGVKSKPPEEILAATAHALSRAKSFHVESTERGSSAPSVTADVGLPKQLRLVLKDRDASGSIVVADGAFYMKGNAAYWKHLDAARDADVLAGRWFKVPLSLAKDLTTALDRRTLSRCLVTEHGTLARGGTATVDGKRAVVIVDKGDRPGTTPGKLYVAASGEPFPVRILVTGKQRPGGHEDPECGDEAPMRAGDEVVFTHYNKPLDVSAPPAAVDLGSARAS